MKTIIDAQGNRLTKEALDAKLDQTLARLQLSEPTATAQARALGEIIRQQTPLSFFVAPSADQMVDLLLEIFHFARSRSETSQVHFIRQGDNSGFLLSLTDDAPYLLHSLQICLRRLGIAFQVVCHPILSVRRDADGRLLDWTLASADAPLESLILFELETGDDFAPDSLLDEARTTVAYVQQVNRDQQPLAQTVRALAAVSQPREKAFWEWLLDDNFLFFSHKRLLLGEQDGRVTTVEEEPGSALGLSWEVVELEPGRPTPLESLNKRFQGRMLRPTRLVVEEVDRISPVYRDRRLTCVGFRETDRQPQIEHTVLGLFTAKANEEPTLNVPYLRQRIEAVLEALSVPPGCHDYRKTLSIFNSFPKVEFFFMGDEEILEMVRSFTNLYRHDAVKVVPAHSLTVRGLTLLIIMPGEFYTKETLERIEGHLVRFFSSGAISSRVIHVSQDYLSLHVSVALDEFDLDFDVERLERGLTTICRPWGRTLRQLIHRRFDAGQSKLLWSRYGNSFPEEYQHIIHPRFALRDISSLEELLRSGRDGFDLWGPFNLQDEFYRLQYYSLKKSYLNDLMPWLDNLNLKVIDEVDFLLAIEGQEVYIKSFTVRGVPGSLPLGKVRDVLLEGLRALGCGELENDPLNRLLILTGLSWRQVDVFRAYRNYYFQLGSPYTKLRVANALINNPRLAELLYRYFVHRFSPADEWTDPAVREEQALMPVRLELISALEQVHDVNEDNILRILFNLIDSTVRTNFFLRQERSDYFLSFKISAIGIIDMPAPRPLFETYVHSASMEGIHLRGGKVARGGIRWSDRPDDFRTEVLGLMKTQMTKNAVIVPVGSKGGFIVKTPFKTREEGLDLSKAAYQTLMRGLLDLCDNRVGADVVPPAGVVCYDSPDPYLVVAADKGTAHLPDTANGVSGEYGFWLKDGFASGGSKGYDHKKLGITARGAWECVKRHFRELGTDIQSEPFSVVGIGDMSGDVFGNGMLLSRKIRLLAAFDHRHVFLDPDPDPETSWQERQRLFNLPRSSWDDYDRNLLSKGGGIYPRDAKEIPLSAEVRQWLGVRQQTIDPQGLISLLLAAQVDLLWNGGIGTYVKASSEKHADAGDRANDGLRIDAGQLRAKVVGEGGNLGLTQRARIEYALAGGRINTDAIDNSAGVDCSDHEVNLKIFLHHLMEQGHVDGESERDSILAEMTDDVCTLVLHNNYTQSLCLSLSQLRCRADIYAFIDLVNRLSDAGLLDRGGEFLPTGKEVLARPGQLLTRPELAILLAYSKMQLFQALLESDLPDAAGVHEVLVVYFPNLIRERFGNEIAGHPLHREITATMLTNQIVDQAGPTFCDRVSRVAGVGLVQTAAAYLALDRALDGPRLRRAIYQLDNRLEAARQLALLERLEAALAGMAQWGLQSGLILEPADEPVARLRDEMREFLTRDAATKPEAQADDPAAELAGLGVAPDIVAAFADLERLKDFLPVASLARSFERPVVEVADHFQQMQDKLDLPWILGALDRITPHDAWDRMAVKSLAHQFASLQYDLVGQMLREGQASVERFLAGRRLPVQNYRAVRERLRGSPPPLNLHPFMVLAGSLRRLLNG